MTKSTKLHVPIALAQDKSGHFSSLKILYCLSGYTVNSEIFTRVLYRETLHMRSFVKIKPWRNSKITLSFTDEGKSWPSSEYVFLMLFTKKNSRNLWTKIRLLPLEQSDQG